MRTFALLLLLTVMLRGEVRVIHWEHTDPSPTAFFFYTSTNLTMPRLAWKIVSNTPPYVVTSNENALTYGALIDLPSGVHYIFGVSSNWYGGKVSAMSNVAALTNTLPMPPLKLQISSALVFSNDTILLRMSNKP